MTTELSPSQLEELATEIASKLADRMESQSALLDYSALAEWLGVSIPSVERLKKEGRIPFISVGRRIVFDRAAVTAALSKQGQIDE